MAGAPIVAPLSLKPCVWYSYKVEKKQRTTTGKNRSSEWRTLDSGVCDSLFYLVDTTGRCAIDPEGASVTPSSRDIWYGNDRTPGRINTPAPWLSYTGITQLGKRYRYTERRIESGDPIYALGDFITHGGAGTDFDRKAAIGDLLRDWKRNKNALLDRFDTNKDGEIDVQEWDMARQTAAKEVDSTRAIVATAPPIDVLGHTRGSRNPFILAAKTEAEMLSRFHYSGLGLFILAMLSSISVLWLISIR